MHSCASRRNVRGATHAGEARAQDELHLPTLVAKLGPYAQSRLRGSHRNTAAACA